MSLQLGSRVRQVAVLYRAHTVRFWLASVGLLGFGVLAGFGASGLMMMVTVIGTLLLPGWLMSYIVFPFRDTWTADDTDDARRALDPIERATFSVLISIVITSGVVFLLGNSASLPIPTLELTPRKLFAAMVLVQLMLAVFAAWRIRKIPIWIPILLLAYTGVVSALKAVGMTIILSDAAIGFGALLLLVVLIMQRFSVERQRAMAARVMRYPFVRYCIIGFGNTALDFSIYSLLTRQWEFWSEHYLLANAIAFSIVVTWSFYWNRRWAFQSSHPRYFAQYARFIATTFGGIVIAETVLYLGVTYGGGRDLMAKVVAAPLIIAWNFFLYRFWAFRKPPPQHDL
jgi:putative flippase GtrA